MFIHANHERGKNMKKRIAFVAMILALSAGSVLPAFAGQWKSSGKTRWYQFDDGSYPKEKWELIDGTWYFFNDNGYLFRGWHNIKGYWYYFDGDGRMLANTWVGDYYVGSTGAMLADCITPDGYRVGQDGKWIP